MTNSESKFIALVKGPAQASEKATGIKASITIAQAILESSVNPATMKPPGTEGGAGWGKSPLFLFANNPFGIKACQGQKYIEKPTHEWKAGEYILIESDFAKFGSLDDGFVAHGKLLSTSPWYASAMAVKDDYSAFAEQIQKDGYSTSGTYAQTLVQLVKQFDLTQYDATDDGAAGVQTAIQEPVKNENVPTSAIQNADASDIPASKSTNEATS